MTTHAVARVVIALAGVLLTGCMDPEVQKEVIKSGVEACKQQGQVAVVFANFAKVEVECAPRKDESGNSPENSTAK